MHRVAPHIRLCCRTLLPASGPVVRTTRCRESLRASGAVRQHIPITHCRRIRGIPRIPFGLLVPAVPRTRFIFLPASDPCHRWTPVGIPRILSHSPFHPMVLALPHIPSCCPSCRVPFLRGLSFTSAPASAT